MSKPKGLVEWVNAHPVPVRPCWLCNIPEAAEVNAARQQQPPVAITRIQRWLIEEKGYPETVCTYGRVVKHFDRRHHLLGR